METRSVIRVDLFSEKSAMFVGGPMMMFRPALPNVPVAGRAMAEVMAGKRALGPRVGTVLRKGESAGPGFETVGGIVNGFRPGVRHVEGQPLAHPLAEEGLERVVVGIGRSLQRVYERKLRESGVKRPSRIPLGCRARGWIGRCGLVNVPRAEQLVTGRAHVGDLDYGRRTQRLLDVEVVVVKVGRAQVLVHSEQGTPRRRRARGGCRTGEDRHAGLPRRRRDTRGCDALPRARIGGDVADSAAGECLYEEEIL